MTLGNDNGTDGQTDRQTECDAICGPFLGGGGGPHNKVNILTGDQNICADHGRTVDHEC